MPTFEAVTTSLKFPDLEARILAFWAARDIFHKSLQQREGAPRWVFYEGPPTANGRPHPGHVLTRVVKDLFPRYKTMRGYSVPRKAGWDTHGLPVEVEVEKELKINGKNQIEEYGVERFVRRCMDSVFRYTADWEELTRRIGFWIDLSDAYVTYHQSYVESVWWSLKQLHAQKLLYQGHKILPWCPRCRTALSSHEVGQGYREVEEPSVFVTFHTAEDPKVSFLAWTTTPWTLPSNSGLAVKADTEYSHVAVAGETLILASALVKAVMGKMKYEVVKTEPGSSLVGRRYVPLFDWWQGRPEQRKEAWKVCAAEFVALDTGSGIVHIAPAFGADDYALGQKEGLPVIQLVDEGGNFTAECGAYAGRFVKDADADLVQDLRSRGLLLKREVYRHDYPFCWRCDAPLIYYARTGWFIRTTREIQRLIANNQAVKWYPDHIRDGRFGNFLETNVDWALSRERYWGTPLPIWQCAGCRHEEALGSFGELKAKPNVRGLDVFDRAKAQDPALSDHLRVHKPWIDAVVYDCPVCSGIMRRVPEVIDCWYDAGAMPFAQWGYPHAAGSQEKFAQAFPADFISEAIDQTRGWFYTLLAESTLLFGAQKYPHPFKTCVVLGHVCDEKGEKMSKHKQNYLDPLEILKEEGADALRWFFLSRNHLWTSMRFGRAAVREAQKEFLIKLWNVYSFFVIYANLDGFDPAQDAALSARLGSVGAEKWVALRGGKRKVEARSELDRWILSELHRTVNKVRACLDDYNNFNAAAALSEFAEGLSNWYVRRSRERFWRSWRTADHVALEDLDKEEAYWTLYECLTTFAQLIAPFLPFVAEEVWRNLAASTLGGRVPESVHLCRFPEPEEALADPELAQEMELVRRVATLGRAARAGAKLKTRQPLQEVIVVLSGARLAPEPGQRPDHGLQQTEDPRQEVLEKHKQVILDELNVKEIRFAADAQFFVDYELKPNFKAIGAKHRELVPAIKEYLQKTNAVVLRNEMDREGKVLLRLSPDLTPVGSKSYVWLLPEEVQPVLKAKEHYAAASAGDVVVVLNTELTPELLEEGFARELVSRINGFRSELKLKYEQRIQLALKGSAKLEQTARKFESYIRGETLATALKTGEAPEGWKTCAVEVEGETGTLALKEV